MEKTDVMKMMESCFPSDLMMFRWVRFHSSRLRVIVAQVD